MSRPRPCWRGDSPLLTRLQKGSTRPSHARDGVPVGAALLGELGYDIEHSAALDNLPSGQVLETSGRQDWLYTPDSPPQDAWRPTVSSVVFNGGTTYTLTGTQLSGLINGLVASAMRRRRKRSRR